MGCELPAAFGAERLRLLLIVGITPRIQRRAEQTGGAWGQFCDFTGELILARLAGVWQRLRGDLKTKFSPKAAHSGGRLMFVPLCVAGFARARVCPDGAGAHAAFAGCAPF